MITSRTSHVPMTKLLIAAIDLVCIAGALFIAASLRLGWEEGVQFARVRVPDLVIASVVYPLVFYVCGLYDDRRLRSLTSAIARGVVSVCIGALLCGLYSYAAMSLEIRRGISLLYVLTLFVSVVIVRFVFGEAYRRGVFSPRCLVVGSQEETRKVIDLVRRFPSAELKIVGLVFSGGERIRAGTTFMELPVLGALDSIEGLAAQHGISRLLLAATHEEEPALLKRLRPLRYRGLGLYDFVSLHESLAREIPLDHIDDQWLLLAATSNSMFHVRRLKRLIDVIGSLVILVPSLFLILPFAALAIKLTSKGPILFSQTRLGLGSEPFTLFKLRTMYVDAEKLTGPVWSTDNDPRITPIGRILRKFRIDELPQLFNVLRGEMSLVGPRPERPEFVEKLAEVIPFYAERLLVRPGITGWAQVMAPYAASIEDTRCKLQYDLYYTKHVSLFLDTLIFVKTLKTMLFGRERVQGGRRAGQQQAVVSSK